MSQSKNGLKNASEALSESLKFQNNFFGEHASTPLEVTVSYHPYSHKHLSLLTFTFCSPPLLRTAVIMYSNHYFMYS